MTTLFEETFNEPLPSRLRRDNLDELVGQTHLEGKGKKQKGKRSKVSQNRYQTVEKKGRYLLLYRTS